MAETITLFTVPDCPRCAAVKDRLQAQHLTYEEVNVAGDFANLRRLRRLTASRQVPVLACGDAVLVTPDPEALEAFLQAHRPPQT